ncbi:MAG TPA: hypothetical protein VGC11_11440 [Acidimicrobiia bacterium]|jgi:hypothetical protein
MAMSNEHKAALAEGRRQSRAIKLYLQAIASRKPGRPITPDSLRSKLERLEARIAAESDLLRRVDLLQAKLDAAEALAKADVLADVTELEAGFVAHAKPYSTRKGIGYAAWREVGVPAAVLKKAGITRGD